MMNDGRRTQLALGALVFAVIAPVVYVAERLVEHARGGASNLGVELGALHVAYYWRAGSAFLIGIVTAFSIVVLLPKRARSDALPRRLAWLALASFPVLVLLAWWFP